MSRETPWDRFVAESPPELVEKAQEFLARYPEDMHDFIKKYPPGTTFIMEDGEQVEITGYDRVYGANVAHIGRTDGKPMSELFHGISVTEGWIDACYTEGIAKQRLN